MSLLFLAYWKQQEVTQSVKQVLYLVTQLKEKVGNFDCRLYVCKGMSQTFEKKRNAHQSLPARAWTIFAVVVQCISIG